MRTRSSKQGTHLVEMTHFIDQESNELSSFVYNTVNMKDKSPMLSSHIDSNSELMINNNEVLTFRGSGEPESGQSSFRPHKASVVQVQLDKVVMDKPIKFKSDIRENNISTNLAENTQFAVSKTIDTVLEVAEESGKNSDRISSILVSQEDFNEFGAAVLKNKAIDINEFRKVVDK